MRGKKRRPEGQLRSPSGVFANAVLLVQHYFGSSVNIFNGVKFVNGNSLFNALTR